MDIMLDRNGDLSLTPEGDIALTESAAQKIILRLKWFSGEWRWNPDEGLPYTDCLFRKNPDTVFMEPAIRSKIFEVPEITSVRDVKVSITPKTRAAVIRFTALTDLETIREEAEISCRIMSTA